MVYKAKKNYFNNINVRNITDNKVLKYSESNDIPVKIKQTVIFFLNLLCITLTQLSLLQGFLTFSKVQRLNQFSRKNLELIKKTTDLSAFYL